MNDCKEDENPNINLQNHREQLLNHQMDLDRDLEAGSCGGDYDDEETREEGVEGEEGEEGEDGEPPSPPRVEQVIPPLYRHVENGCTSLGCYWAIGTFIVLVIGIIALLMYSSPGNVGAPNVVVSKSIKQMLLERNATLYGTEAEANEESGE